MAALCVLLLHQRAVFGGHRYYGAGYLGVDFFLMLSGYLMASHQEPKLADGRLRPLRFMAARYRRLWPMMTAGALIGLPYLWHRTGGHWGAFTSQAAFELLLLPAIPLGAFLFPLNIPAWTIFFELAVNALHVTLLWRLRGWLAGAGLALLAVAVAWIGWRHGGLDMGALPRDFLRGAARILLAYGLGIALARRWRAHRPFPAPWWLALPLMPVLLPLAWWLGLSGPAFDIAFVLIGCPLMLAGGLRLHKWHGTAQWLGRIAFPLFALQMPILEGAHWLGGPWWLATILALLAGVAGAILPACWAKWRMRVPEM